MPRITIDPVTRIEGHLRIDAEVDGGVVRKAWSSGQMFRGIERILQGRDPREAWLFTQRFCGVCTTVHAIASVRAVENALQLEVPLNAQYIPNLILCAHAMHDHIVHFYHLSALDWVDVVSALKNGQVDAVVVDVPTAFYLTAAQVPEATTVGQFPAPGGDQWGALLQKGSPLTACISAAVDELQSSGELPSIEKKWMSDATDAPTLQ